MIRFENVTKQYGDKMALNGIDLHIEKGEFVFIVGTSGAGKSTLFKVLIKELEPTSGNIFIDGQNVTHLRRRKIPLLRRKVGVVFQDFRLLKDRTVYENIAFAQRVIGVHPSEIKRNVSEMLTLCGISEKYRALPSQLSGGEQQRVALARALVNRPDVLLADEPTGNLDDGNTRIIMDLLEKINERGTTVVVVTHNTEIVRTMHKRVINLKNGIIVNDIQGGTAL
ncbi:MAG: cell division ATP-binding protein FtsE [Parasporobacterium sp.]|nr:cell division ATP-binding protein FtsE [Parasporobacterium sp.]